MGTEESQGPAGDDPSAGLSSNLPHGDMGTSEERAPLSSEDRQGPAGDDPGAGLSSNLPHGDMRTSEERAPLTSDDSAYLRSTAATAKEFAQVRKEIDSPRSTTDELVPLKNESKLLRSRVSVQDPFTKEQIQFLRSHGVSTDREPHLSIPEGRPDDSARTTDTVGRSVLPHDTYSYFAAGDCLTSEEQSKCPRRPAITCAVVIMIVQALTLSLLAVDIIDLENEDNPIGIPPGASAAVRLSQLLAMLITVISQDEIRQSLNVLYVGKPSAYESISPWRWQFSIWARMVMGLLGLSVTFMLIMQSDSVRELLLNFMAVEFVSKLDDIVFEFGRWGYMGRSIQERSKDIEATKSESDKSPTCFCTVLFVVVLYAVLLAGWLWIAIKQERGDYLPQTIFVQFGDEFSPDLGTFSGSYRLNTRKKPLFRERAEYVAEFGTGFDVSAKFGYCEEERVWTFTYGPDSSQIPNSCDYKAKSSESTSFDITSTAHEPWFVRADSSSRVLPLQWFSLSSQDLGLRKKCSSSQDCSGKLSCEAERCVCQDQMFGSSCEFADPCQDLEVDARLTVFTDSRSWSTIFEMLCHGVEMLCHDYSKSVQVYNRPVFLGNTQDEGNYDIIFFTGRHWVLTQTGRLNDLAQRQDINLTHYLATEFHAHWSEYSVAFVSEPMDIDTPKDAATPAGLQWYHSTPSLESRSEIQQADTNRPSGAVLLCAVCDDIVNPCFYNATCDMDGKCECITGSSGALCQVAPVHNGQCDLFFNTPEFEYDGGDCCQMTCESTAEHLCGQIPRPAFSLLFHQNVGYPNCADPEQLCDPPDKACWKSIYEVTGKQHDSGLGSFYTSISGNGAVLVARGRDHVAWIFEQAGSQWVQRGEPFEDVLKIHLSDDGNILALAKEKGTLARDENGTVVGIGNYTTFVQVFRWEAFTSTWNQLGDDLYVANFALSGDGMTLAVVKVSNGAIWVEAYRYESWADWKELPGFYIPMSKMGVKSIALSENGSIVAFTSANEDYLFFVEYDPSTKAIIFALQIPVVGDEAFYIDLSSDGHDFIFALKKLGAVGILHYNGTDLLLTATIPISDIDYTDYWTSRVSLSGNGQVLAIGNQGSSLFTDSVQIYEYDSTSSSWAEQGPAITSPHHFFGYTVSLSNDGRSLAVGAPLAQAHDLSGSLGEYAGLVKVYHNAAQVAEPRSTVPQVPVTIVIKFDDFPVDTGVSLKCDDTSYVDAPATSFRNTERFRYQTVKDVFLVPEGSTCDFAVTDSEANGLISGGFFNVYYGDDDTPSQANLLAEGGFWFGARQLVSFKAAPPPSDLVPVTLAFTPVVSTSANGIYLHCDDGVLEIDNPKGVFSWRNVTGWLTHERFLLPIGTRCDFIIEDKDYTFAVFYGDASPLLDENGQLQISEDQHLLYRWDVKNVTGQQTHTFTVSPNVTVQTIDLP